MQIGLINLITPNPIKASQFINVSKQKSIQNIIRSGYSEQLEHNERTGLA